MLHRMLPWFLLFLVICTEGCRVCHKGVKKVNCLVNPCKGKTCANARCRQNRCGGCNRLWYSKGSDVTKHCEFKCPTKCLPGVKTVNCLVDPCRFASCAAFPTATCCSSYCGGCHAIWFLNGDRVTC